MSANRYTSRRRSTPHARGACQTCKSRHLRCLQERPTCSSCRKSHRPCNYLSLSSPQPSDALKVILWRNSDSEPRIALSTTTWRSDDLQLFHRFQTRCCSSLGGQFDDVFWNRVIHQGSEHSVSVRNAVIAVTLLWSSEQSTNFGNIEKGLSHYHKAVCQLRETLYRHKGAKATEEALLCNILFVCIELCQQNYESALGQLSTGLNLFCEWNRAFEARVESRNDSNEVQTAMSMVYRKLLAQAMLFVADEGATRPILALPEILNPRPLPNRFASLSDARNNLLDLASGVIHQPHSLWAEHTADEIFVDTTVRPWFQLDIKRLHEFSIVFNRSFSAPLGGVNVKERMQRIIIQVQLLGLQILALTRHQEEPEWEFDLHRKSFARIVTLANEAHAITLSNAEWRQGLTLDMELIPPLYLTAARCRDSTIRWNALKLLRGFARQEGLWNGNMLAALAEDVIRAEEDVAGLDRGVTTRLTLLGGTIKSSARNVRVTFAVKCQNGSPHRLLRKTIHY